jgi:hypothetical protein
MKINTVQFEDDGTPLSCDVTMSISEAAMMVDLLGKVKDIAPEIYFAFAQFEGLFNGLYKDGIEGYRRNELAALYVVPAKPPKEN